MATRLLITVLLVLLARGTSSTPLQLDTASVRGNVTRLGTTIAVAGATVELRNASNDVVRTATTSSSGTFEFTGVVPGSYRLSTTPADMSLVPVEYMQRAWRGRGLLFALSSGQILDGLKVEVPLASSISGRIIDSDGQGVGYARVLALRPLFVRGERVLRIVQTVQSNDRGEYRFFWLSPGDYFVAARPDGFQRRTVPFTILPPGYVGTSEEGISPIVIRRGLEDGTFVEETYPISYYGGVDISKATVVKVQSGSNVGATDITLVDRIATHRIRGRVTIRTTGEPSAGASVRAVPVQAEPQVVIPTATTDARGDFELLGAMPGPYLVVAAANTAFNPLSAEGMTGLAQVTVDTTNVEGVVVTITRGFDIAGRVEIDGGADRRIDFTRVRIALRRDPDILGMPLPAPGAVDGAAVSPVTADGGFTFRTVAPGQYSISLTAMPPGAYVKSIRMGNRSLLDSRLIVDATTDQPLAITLGGDGAALDGRVTTERQIAVPNASVVLIPENSLRDRRDLFRTFSTDVDGRFHGEAIMPGRYTLLAWEAIEDGRWEDPTFTRLQEARGTIITLAADGRQSVVVTAIRNEP